MQAEDREEIRQMIMEQTELLRTLLVQENTKLRKDIEPWIRATEVLDSLGRFSKWIAPIFKFFFVVSLISAFIYVASKKLLN